ncbi:MAG: sugar phosphate isomerase/epimerase family protein [Candidatus Nanopelagicales bacterium]
MPQRAGVQRRPALQPPRAEIRVALSTSSVYPEATPVAFEIAAKLGYDGLELMVFTDAISQDPEAVKALAEYHGVPVLSVHAPCLLVTQRVWGNDPWEKLRLSVAAADRLGAEVVVVHPPFRWQRDYAREFVDGVAEYNSTPGVRVAVENMYPWRLRGRAFAAYSPDWDPRGYGYDAVTMDTSHTAVSGTDPRTLMANLGDRLAHVHLADGTGLARDEHLIPGRGTQPCADVLAALRRRHFKGVVVVEASTRRAATRADREADLAEALRFARRHLRNRPHRPLVH